MIKEPENGVLALKNRLQANGSLILDVKVVARASNSGVAGLLDDGSLKLKICAAPEKGKANQEVCRLLSQFFGVPERSIAILSGRSSPRKRISLRIAT
jgi:hypothetical protein